MNHIGTITLETERLTLRAFTPDDAEAIFRNWASDPDVTKYLMWMPHENIEATRKVLSDIWVSQYDKMDFYQWAIVPKLFGEPIGSIGAVQVNDRLELVHIGYCIGRRWWGQGITAEALAELIRFFFTQVCVNRIESRHDPRNPNSGKVMLKCGMKYEGTHRQADWNNQGICDSVMYAVLIGDYFAGQAQTGRE